MKNTMTIAPESVELKYTLTELPSSQHRAGLAGLVMLLQDLEKGDRVTGALKELSDRGVSVVLNETGLKNLLDEVYAASEELQGRDAAFKGVEPTKIEEQEFVDPKTNKSKLKKVYYYPQIVPKGQFLEASDETQNKVWIKLWRDMVWQIMRGVPATRRPYEDRASGKDSSDIKSTWKQISQEFDKPTDLASTYFIGAQAANAERVNFKDLGRYQFLLHFWTFATQIYVPQSIDRDNKRTFEGYCLAVPDVSRLKTFCDDYRLIMKRSADTSRYRPKDAIIEIPEEAALDTFRRLTEVIKAASFKHETRNLVFGVDIFHTVRDGNNVRLLYSGRVEPKRERDDAYSEIKQTIKDSFFKKQRLLNLLANREWYHGFDKLLGKLPIDQGLMSKFFSIDARTSFTQALDKHNGRMKMKGTTGNVAEQEDVCLEALVLKIIDGYLGSKLSDKYDLEWKNLTDDKGKRDYSDKKTHLGKECFYAIRSRTGEDFINFFAANICSVPQRLTRNEYLKVTSELYKNTEQVRTLSMIALSARVGRSTDKKEESTNEQ